MNNLFTFLDVVSPIEAYGGSIFLVLLLMHILAGIIVGTIFIVKGIKKKRNKAENNK